MVRTNFNYLLVSLLVFLLAVPVADDLGIKNPAVVKAAVFTTILVIGMGSLKGAGRTYAAGMFFVIAGIVFNILATRFESLIFQLGSLAALIGFLLVAIWHTGRQVIFGVEVSANRIVGVICVYLLLGVIWALAYSIVELMSPGSFAGFEAWSDRGWDSEWLYFSFVTMTTLGYGDLLPISATARVLAYLQAVFGQFYIAILVAGLVGVFIARREPHG